MSTKIEWAEDVWNPILGCSKVSAGCENCYAMRFAWRMMHNPMVKDRYAGLAKKTAGGAINWTGKINLQPAALWKPFSARKPTRFFVNSMSDLFHPDVPFEFIDRVWSVMFYNEQHTFLILTKRPERMLEFLSWRAMDKGERYALPNVWLGVSVENQQTANERIPFLLQADAAVRWLSMEPLLGKIDLTEVQLPSPQYDISHLNPARINCLTAQDDAHPLHNAHNKIDWVVAGGESGPKARPMHPDWARTIRDQCAAAGVPFFFKQWGEHIPIIQMSDEQVEQFRHFPCDYPFGALMPITKVGKKGAGRLLCGVEHNGMP